MQQPPPSGPRPDPPDPEPAKTPITVDPDFMSPAYIGTMTHFYRGELGRMMIWRQRFDATTNWSVVATGSFLAFAVGTPEMTNVAMLISLFVLGFFSFIEARRYRFYDTFRARVRMLEVHFVGPALLGYDRRLLQGPWREQLAQDLLTPSYKCSFAFALGRRFRHVYFALHGFVVLGWAGLNTLDATGFASWVDSFRIGKVSGPVVIALVLAYLGGLLTVIVRSGALRAESGEMGRYRRSSQAVWRKTL